jgi:hypothetical protein
MVKKMIIFCLAFFAFCLYLFSGSKKGLVSTINLNNIQVVGSHNSYKKEIQPALLKLIKSENSETAMTLDYHHVSITQQLNIGLRGLELDVVSDPKGGRYASPHGNELLTMLGITPLPYDSLGEMIKPGFKVMHVPDLDFRSWCPTLVDGLKQIKDWSDANPNHLPIIITFNAKSDGIPRKDFVRLLPFTQATFDSLDSEIYSVFSKDRIITPDDVRGGYQTLNESVRAHNWPLLDNSRGKIMFVLDETGQKQITYLQGHPSLQGRVMFVNAEPGTDASAFVILNDPVRYQDSISSLVKQGYIVRTRADADTREARSNDYKRLDAAINSGAQIITTDYYLPDNNFQTDYHVNLPGGIMMRYNPVLLPDSVTAKLH